MWRKANLRRWIAAFQRHPKVGLAGFVLGLLYGAMTTYFYRMSAHRTGALTGIFALPNVSPIVTALLGIVVLLWLSGTLRLPQKPGAVFIMCIFPGALVELLLSGIICTLTRAIA